MGKSKFTVVNANMLTMHRVDLVTLLLSQEAGQFDPLFEHTELFTSCRDDQVAFRANMIEKQRKYGILLHNCDLMEMTDARVEEETMEMKEKFNGRKISTRKRVTIRLLISYCVHYIHHDTYFFSSVRLKTSITPYQ